MDEVIGTIKLKCKFCSSDQFELLDGYEPKVGDMVKCSNCGELNDFESRQKAAHEEGMKLAKEYGDEIFNKINSSLNKTLKGNKNIIIHV